MACSKERLFKINNICDELNKTLWYVWDEISMKSKEKTERRKESLIRESSINNGSPIIIVLSKSESVEFSLTESVICLFTDSSVQKYVSLTNQLIFTDWINEKNLFHC